MKDVDSAHDVGVTAAVAPGVHLASGETGTVVEKSWPIQAHPHIDLIAAKPVAPLAVDPGAVGLNRLIDRQIGVAAEDITQDVGGVVLEDWRPGKRFTSMPKNAEAIAKTGAV